MLEPVDFTKASKDPLWIDAMKAEMNALEQNHTWDLVELPTGKKHIGCKCIYKVKLLANGQVERYKAKLVTKGYNQKEGIDFKETFSPVAKMPIIRAVISIAAQKNWR